MRRLAFLLFVLLAALHGALALDSSERILSFHSDIAVNPDASLQVRESIRVRAAGARIRHGIYRDFPTRYRDRWGNRVVVELEVLEVTRGGQLEPWHSEAISNGVRIYFGSKDNLLSPGEYAYGFAYRVRRELGFFADHDELYWNVTGNGWAFAIEQASATVALPAAIPVDKVTVAGYTGRQGSREQALRSAVAPGPYVEFLATRGLQPGEGLTIVVGWPKGFVSEPTSAEQFHYLLRDNLNIVVAAAGLLLLFLYYGITWSRVGKDPKAGVIMPLYEPPAGLSPAAMRYLVKMGFDNKVVSAAILNMAVKNYLSIAQSDGVYTLTRATADKNVLAPEERLVADKLLAADKSLELKRENHTRIQAAITALKTSLKTSEERIYFFTNGKYLIPGLVLSALLLVGVILAAPSKEAVALGGFMAVWLTGWSVGVFFLSLMVYGGWKAALSGSSGALGYGGATFITLFSLPFWAGEIFGLTMLVRATSLGVALVLAAVVFLNLLFHYLLKAPTHAGRALLDNVEGFKMFLSAVEQDRMNVLTPPQKTPALFEKYLPYALALDVEQAWAEQFSGVLDRAGQPYSPAWYSGGMWSTLGAAAFASSFGTGMSSAIAASATSPGSGSGFGGGGSSGGGGGGGGGGGW